MKKVFKKRQVVIAALVLALGSAVFINWYYSKSDNKLSLDSVTTTISSAADNDNLGDAAYVEATAKASNKTDETFSTLRIKRDSGDDEAKSALADIIKDKSSAASAVSEATKSLKELSSSIKLQSDLETLIQAKTNSECIVIIDGKKVEAVVEKGVLNDSVSLQIKDIIVNHGNFSSENITIIELNS